MYLNAPFKRDKRKMYGGLQFKKELAPILIYANRIMKMADSGACDFDSNFLLITGRYYPDLFMSMYGVFKILYKINSRRWF